MNKYLSTTEVKVSIDFGKNIQTIGRLAARERTVYFEYDGAFIRSGIEISPIHLPLQPGVKSFDCNLFEGLPGVFNDSLPDGWGRLLLDRLARSLGILPADITPLDRLTHVGTDALGALIYEPDHSANDSQFDINLDNLASQTQKVLDGTSEEVFSELIALNGSSAGARPKAMIGVSNERDHVIHGIGELPNGYRPSIVKFPNSQDGIDAGAIEYIYALMAKEAGIFMPRVHLFPAERGTGYFAIERFDRDGGKRLHMHTACGLLHSDFRTPSLDYEDLIALTGLLTRDVREVEKLYQLAVFNVLAHNRDDHPKNFSYLMDHLGEWKLSPAYDLTFSSGPQGEQSTMVMGEGRNPNTNHLLQLAEEAKIKQGRAVEIIKTTKASLAQWSTLAKHYGVSDANIELIQKKIIEQIE